MENSYRINEQYSKIVLFFVLFLSEGGLKKLTLLIIKILQYMWEFCFKMQGLSSSPIRRKKEKRSPGNNVGKLMLSAQRDQEILKI